MEDLSARNKRDKAMQLLMNQKAQLAEQLAAIIERADIGILIHNETGLLFANPYVLERMQVTSFDQIKGRNVLEFVHPDDHAVIISQIEQIVQHGTSFYREPFRHINRSGDCLEIEQTSMPIHYEGQMAILVIALDMTERNTQDRALKHMLEKNKILAQRVMSIQEQERIMIARNLHDDSGQLLTAISANLMSIKPHVTATDIQARITDTEQMVGQLFSTIRVTLDNLDPTHIDAIGLSGALRNNAELWAKRYAITVNIDACDLMDHLNTELATSVFRIAQEAMTNIAKYAAAKHVWLRMHKLETALASISLSIRDDGCGFDIPTAEGKGFGLLNMKVRADQIGATLRIESIIDKGTSIYLDLALTTPENA